MADNLTKQQRSYCMSRIRSKNTKIEKILVMNLRKKGFKFKTNYSKLQGKPDIVFLNKKIIIFVDGDFWHGKDYLKRYKTYNKYWKNKILNNIKRDRRNARILKKSGYKVIRIWGSEIKKDMIKQIKKIEAAVSIT